MRKNIQRFVASALVLGLTASLTFGAMVTPAHAQAEDGVLTDVGEGENRVLSTELRTLNPGQQITYQFVYDGNEQPIESTSYPVITTVPAGTVLTVLGRNETNTWLAVRLEDGTEGWVTRSLTNYFGLALIVLTPEPLPTPTPLPGVTATPTPSTAIVVVAAPTPEALDGSWKVIREGETHWYTFQYRGGGLPVHVWMDVEPDQGAVFNILNQDTALSILAGVAPTVVNAIGRGTANPVEPGYLFWRADFPEADILYVMVQHEGPGDVVYSIHAAGPGLGRPVIQ